LIRFLAVEPRLQSEFWLNLALAERFHIDGTVALYTAAIERMQAELIGVKPTSGWDCGDRRDPPEVTISQLSWKPDARRGRLLAPRAAPKVAEGLLWPSLAFAAMPR